MNVLAPCRGRAPLCALALAACLLPVRALAQADAVQLPPDRFGIKAPQAPVTPGAVAAVPQQPFVVPQPRLPAIPLGSGGNPQPQTPPSRDVEPSGAPTAAGVFTYFKNQVVQPAGARRSTSSVVSPAAANVQDTILQTGNWYAALSRDTGQTWTDLDPATFFPAADGGFCCNQRVDYIRSHDITVWLLEYGYSPLTMKGSHQIAVANGRDELRSGNAADWTRYRFDPTDFGFALGTWLNYADVGFNDDWLYVSANVFDASSNFVGAVVWRVSLFDLENNGSVTFTYLTDTTMGGSSYRFATRAGDGTNMYWATLMSTTSIRIWRQNTIGISRNYVDRTTAAWQNTFTDTCAGPDGRGWLGSAKGVIRGACGNATELTFAWTSDGNGGNRPLPYTRVARFLVSDRSLVVEHDVYSLTDCWAYAALDSNSLGHIGGVIAIGGPSRQVRTSAFLIDQYENSWLGVVAYRMADPTNNPAGESFGSAFDVQRSWVDERTFIGTGNLMNGGDQQANVEPHHVWFGRDNYQPTWVTLDVDSTPVRNIPIKIDVTDNNNLKDGNTGFTRTFMPHQGYVVTAPLTVASGPDTLIFYRWSLNGSARPLGANVLTVDDMGTTDDTVVAEYRARRTITFETSSHLPSAPILLSPADLSGQSNGSTRFTRHYLEGTQVTMTVHSPILNNHPFRRWRINGTAQPEGQQSVVYTVGNGDALATAVYYEHVSGSYTPFGAGCSGSNGLNRHVGGGTPETNQTLQWRLLSGLPSSPAVLFLGVSNTTWLGVPLPIPLPGAPQCLINVSIDLSLNTTTNASGTATVSIAVPDDVSLIGSHVYTQFGCVDLAANVFGITTSDGLDTVLGGLR